LGKFDGLHRGHCALAAAASRLGGAPWLVSFSGMAEVLGWPARLPLVAPADRRRVLASWAPACGGRPPAECAIPFAQVRALSPEAFVAVLAEELRVGGVVVGSNYRFGYRAAGTAGLLRELGPAYGLKIDVVELVEGGAAPNDGADADADDGTDGERREPSEAVSSSRVREALAAGDLRAAAACLGRPYRLVVDLPGEGQGDAGSGGVMRLPASAYNNQPPGRGAYRVEAQVAAAAALDLPHVGGGRQVEVRLLEGALEVPAAAVGRVPGGKLLLDFF
jgi:FAD synthase